MALYRLGSVTVPAETAATARRIDLVTLELVRANFLLLERAIGRIADRPSRMLRSTSAVVSPFEARRVVDREISYAMREGHMRKATAAETRAAPGLVCALRGNWIPHIREAKRFEQTDTYENRALAGFIRWLDCELRRLMGRLAQTDDQEVAPIWRSRIEGWRSRLARLQRREIFNDLIPDPQLHPTTRFRMHPDYATAFSAMMRIRGGLGQGHGLAPAVPIDRTYALYEMWCYVGLLNAAADAFPECRPDVAKLLTGLSAPDQLGVSLRQGSQSSIRLSDCLTLTYQRRFSTGADAEGARTTLLEVVPDMVVSRSDEFGRCVRLAVMDPKYRIGGSLLDGLRDLHVYRDAILGDSGPLATLAIAMTPRPAPHSLSSTTLCHDRPYAVTVRPGHDPEVFADLLQAVISALT